jgi:membrane protein DedA with SNARE-associated domain
MVEWVIGVVQAGGWPAVLFLMFLENLFPPIPSEVIMPLAGFVVARGQMSMAAALLAGVAGTLLGNMFWYELSRLIGADRIRPLVGRYGRWFAVGEEDLRKAERTLEKYGPFALSFGRLLPGIRTVISIPAGLIRIPRHLFYLWTAIGSTVWTTFLLVAGYFLEDHYDQVEKWIDPLAYVVVGGILITYFWHIWTTRIRKQG